MIFESSPHSPNSLHFDNIDLDIIINRVIQIILLYHISELIVELKVEKSSSSPSIQIRDTNILELSFIN